MSDTASVRALYRDMSDRWLEEMRLAFLLDREGNRTNGRTDGVRFCDSRLTLIKREQARRERAVAASARTIDNDEIPF